LGEDILRRIQGRARRKCGAKNGAQIAARIGQKVDEKRDFLLLQAGEMAHLGVSHRDPFQHGSYKRFPHDGDV
jgi:hypothetical protein